MHQLFQDIVGKLPEMEGIQLTNDQNEAVTQFLRFFQSDDGKETLLLTGSAGTGKTLLIHLFSSFLKKMGWKVILLAPTGRAAKVISKRTGKTAFTLHHHIFSVEEALQGQPFFSLKENKEKQKVCYIIDEASMMGDQKDESLSSGLLQNTLRYVFDNDENRKLMLIGDPVQLPPVGSNISPALEYGELTNKYNLTVFYAHLEEVKRQDRDSLVLQNAVMLRDAYLAGEETPTIEMTYGRDVQTLDNGYDALETFSGYYEEGNLDKVLFITYSNGQAMKINQALRQKILETDALLVAGDLVMVVRNNYTWGTQFFPFLANGEMGCVIEIYQETYEEKYGLKWVNALIGFEDSAREMKEIECKIILDLLNSKLPQLSPEQMYNIWQARLAHYIELPKKDQDQGMQKDPYLHALQIKYGYCITGHKSQGGQWENVIIAFEPDYGKDIHAYLRWTYTVLTRAEQRAFLLSCPFG